MGFNDYPRFERQKPSRGCVKPRHSHGQLVGESSSRFQAKTSSIQKADTDVGQGLYSPKTWICTRWNILGFYTCLMCVCAQLNHLLLGDTFGELHPAKVTHYLLFLVLGYNQRGVSAGLSTNSIRVCCFLSCILSQSAQTGL